MIIGIIGAFEAEIEQFIKMFHLKKIDDKEIYTGTYDNKNLIVANSGIGKVNSGAMTQYLIDHYPINYIINSGCAGSLKEDVKLLDTVISSTVTYHDFEPVRVMAFSVPDEGMIKADKKLIGIAEQAMGTEPYYIAPICSGDCFVTDSIMRDKIYNKTGAYAVDMESGSIGHICRKNNIPFIAIRTISDFADGADDFEIVAAHKSSELVNQIIELI